MPTPAQKPKAVSQLYDDAFYDYQLAHSYSSAQVFVEHLAKIYRPHSVADVGCGRGPWLKAFGESGAGQLVGFDGSWNGPHNLVDPAIEFRAVDLNSLTPGPDLGQKRFDLAMSLEVAEHLKPERSPMVVASMCALSDVVMFGAAIPHQPGTGHINTEFPSFWARLFADNGFLTYDYFRPEIWGRKGIPYWYQQNTILYVRNGHPLHEKLREAGYRPIDRLETLDAVHPAMFEWFASETGSSRIRRKIRERVKKILPESAIARLSAIRRAAKRQPA
ncbi:MAG: class I SAM-dependent methyltransferase, partial [Sphingobium sp.]